MTSEELMAALNKAVERGPLPVETADEKAIRLAEFLPSGSKYVVCVMSAMAPMSAMIPMKPTVHVPFLA